MGQITAPEEASLLIAEIQGSPEGENNKKDRSDLAHRKEWHLDGA